MAEPDRSGPAGLVRRAWIAATIGLGGDRDEAQRYADELVRGYGEPVRHYHGLEHVAFVLDRVDALGGGLPSGELWTVRAAAAAHDVVYRGRPGDDERDSAAWAVEALTAAGVATARRVGELVLATADHRARDRAAAVLLDADLAILAAPAPDYLAYVAAVRSEYAHVDDEQWRTGRSAVLRDLLDRDHLYSTDTGRRDWAGAARANMSAELASLSGARPAG